MIIHQAIRYLYHNYGHGILLGKRLFNLMKDYHFFDYEDSSLESTFEIVIMRYGEQFYNGITNRNWISSYNRTLMDCKKRFGFKDDLLTYIFESIAYGFDSLPSISKNYYTSLNDRESRWEIYMIFYQLCGFNLIPINGDIDNWESNEKSFKNPAYSNWDDFKNDEINIALIKDIASNKDHTGLGGILGVNNLLVLDFDDIGLFTKVVNGPWLDNYTDFEDFVKYCLRLLGLPEDYQWVVRSGGGCGFHIIFKTDDVPNFTPELMSFKARKNLSNDYLTHNDSIEWLKCCDTPEGQNMLAIKYIERNEYDKASEILLKFLDFSFAAFNYAVLMSYGHVPFSTTLLSNLRQTFEKDSRISQHDVEKLFERIDTIKLNK